MTSTEQHTDGGTSSVGDAGRVTERGLAEVLGELARSLAHEPDIDATLDAIVHAAVGTVPGAEHASISVVQRGHRLRTRAATDARARDVDLAQADTGQGPSVDTLYEHTTVRASDLADEQRWPDFTVRAVALGVASMLAVQLYIDGDHLGALNLHSSRRAAFDAESEHVAQLFAAHAAVAMSSAQERASLTRAVSTRQLIGQAQGILMERFRIAEDRAFAVLVKASQDLNRKLVDIAGELVRSGEMPTG